MTYTPTPKCYALIMIILLLSTNNAYSQFFNDFDSISNMDQSEWKGDLAHFVINDLNQLQLNAPEGGYSFIYHPSNIPDSVEFSFYVEMDFNPSKNNKLKVYLFLDTFDLEVASGYYIEIGENGNEDKLSFGRLIDGEGLIIGEGSPGLFATGPLKANVKVVRDKDGYWQIFIRMHEETVFQKDLEVFDSTVKRYFDQYFAIECYYTETRKDKFVFDDVGISQLIPDTLAPEVVSLEVVDERHLKLLFDEVLDQESILDPLNYILNNGWYPESIMFQEFKPNQIILAFIQEFSGNTSYTLKLSGVSDLEGNKLINQEVSFYLTEKADKGDVVINEILFNPYEKGEDFVEIYNNSQKIIEVNSLYVQNADKTDSPIRVESQNDLFPGEYLAISPDTSGLYYFYSIPLQAHLCESKLPGFNNDEGNVSLLSQRDGEYRVIDSMNYYDSMHFELLIDTEGISLERLDPNLSSMVASSWYSSATLSGGATPGFENSQAIQQINANTGEFYFDNKVFSPDSDGWDDLMVLHYQLPKEGFMISAVVFSIEGYFIKSLSNNQIAGTSGIIRWDGLDENARLALMGPYIIWCQLFHPDGDRFEEKLVTYLVE